MNPAKVAKESLWTEFVLEQEDRIKSLFIESIDQIAVLGVD